MPRLTSPLPLRDTALTYGRVTRLLHWTIAALMLWQFTGMGLRLILGRHPVAGFFVSRHQMVGTVLFLLILLRILWALSNRGNRPDHGAGLIRIAAKAGHGFLYLAMLIVPLAGIIRAWGGTRAYAPFGFEIFPARDADIPWAVALGDAVHGELAWIMGLLILGHVAMVAVHEILWRDGTLARMTGR